MKLNAVGVTTTNMKRSVDFYKLLGFEFGDFKEDEDHVDSINTDGARLMIDTNKLLTDLLGTEPTHSNHANFAIQYDSAEEVNNIAAKVEQSDGKLTKPPYDAFWGQRYVTIADPDGNMMDLYANL